MSGAVDPLVSVIIPVHNGAAFIREALGSVFAQAHRPLEVVVADDGSTDATVDLVEGFEQEIRVLKLARGGRVGCTECWSGGVSGTLACVSRRG